MESLAFEASDRHGETVLVDQAYVHERLTGIMADEDLSRFIL